MRWAVLAMKNVSAAGVPDCFEEVRGYARAIRAKPFHHTIYTREDNSIAPRLDEVGLSS